MKKFFLLLVLMGLMACSEKQCRFPEAFLNPDPELQNYHISYGDVLNISVWKEEALTRQLAVLPDGNITFPLIGNVKAQGKTVDEIKDLLSEKLTRYMDNATLSVEVQQPNSMKIYVIGKVNNPGNFFMHENMTVMKALALARGLNPYADKDDIRIFRTIDGHEYIFYFNYDEVTKGKKLAQNIILKRGDMIVVP